MSSIRTRVVLFAEVGHSFDEWTSTTGWKIDNRVTVYLDGNQNEILIKAGPAAQQSGRNSCRARIGFI